MRHHPRKRQSHAGWERKAKGWQWGNKAGCLATEGVLATVVAVWKGVASSDEGMHTIRRF